jgi:hypothetical protein
MMIAREYGQDPRTVAEWDPEWLAAASTVMAAEAGARAELERKAKRKRNRKGA